MRIWSIHETSEPQVTLTWFLHNTEPSKQHLNIHLRYKYKCLEREQHFKTERRFLQNFYISNPAFSDFATPSLDENIKPFPLQYINQYITVSIFSRYEKKTQQNQIPFTKEYVVPKFLEIDKDVLKKKLRMRKVCKLKQLTERWTDGQQNSGVWTYFFNQFSILHSVNKKSCMLQKYTIQQYKWHTKNYK